MFGKMKELYDLQKKAREIQKQLKNIVIEKEAGAAKVKVNGEFKVQEINIDPEMVDLENINTLERDLKDALDQATNEAQKIAAEKMKDIGGGLGIPGL